MVKLNSKFISMIFFALMVIVSAEVIFEERFNGSYISLFLSISYLVSKCQSDRWWMVLWFCLWSLCWFILIRWWYNLISLLKFNINFSNCLLKIVIDIYTLWIMVIYFDLWRHSWKSWDYKFRWLFRCLKLVDNITSIN